MAVSRRESEVEALRRRIWRVELIVDACARSGCVGITLLVFSGWLLSLRGLPLAWRDWFAQAVAGMLLSGFAD